jgi:hypothetical protein
MAKAPLTIDHIKTGKYVLHIESVGLTRDQSSPALRRYVAKRATLGFLIYPPERRVYVYRPGYASQQLDNSQSVSGSRTPRLHLGPDGNLAITRLTAFLK